MYILLSHTLSVVSLIEFGIPGDIVQRDNRVLYFSKNPLMCIKIGVKFGE